MKGILKDNRKYFVLFFVIICLTCLIGCSGVTPTVLDPRVTNVTTQVDYDTIQEAIDAALDGEEILVYPGTYQENILFDGKDITVSSTNPLNSAIVAVTIIDGGGSDSVVKFTGGDTSTLQGFTIQNGNASTGGGGIYIDNSDPTIIGNTITGNMAGYLRYGGGIYTVHSSPTITGNTISHNTAGSGGGGIWVSTGSPAITDNIITDNEVAWGFGGGIEVWLSSPTITGNTISHNTARIGGGIYTVDSSPTITGNHIKFNTATSGGGMYIVESTVVPIKIGGTALSDTDNFNTICGNTPDQLLSHQSYPYPYNYISSTCAIPFVVPVTGVSILQGDFFQIYLGAEPFQLTIEVEPVLATNKAVTWTSSNPDLATVDGNGLLTAVAEHGIAIITVTTVDGGFTDSVEIEAVAIY